MSTLTKSIAGATLAFIGLTAGSRALNQREVDEQNYREVMTALHALDGAPKILADIADTANSASAGAQRTTRKITQDLVKNHAGPAL